MTLHLTLTWLWWGLGVLWFVGMLVYQFGLTVAYMDGTAPWWARLAGFFWPVVVPCYALLAFFCIVFGMDGSW